MSARKHNRLKKYQKRRILALALLLIAAAAALLIVSGVKKIKAKQSETTDPQTQQQTGSSDNPTQDGQTQGDQTQDGQQQGETQPQSYDFYSPVPAGEAVGNDYFDDAVFVGNSVMQRFTLSSGLDPINAFAARNIMVDTIFTAEALDDGTGTGKKITIMDALKNYGHFGKAYVMLGVNELGWVSVDTFKSDYGKVIDALREISPDAIIYVESILPVTTKKSDNDKVYNNERIAKYNAALQELCGEKQAYYLNVAASLANEDGSMPEADAVSDGVHPTAESCGLWLKYLKNHTAPVSAAQ